MIENVATLVEKIWQLEREKEAIKAAAEWMRERIRNVARGVRRNYNQQVIRDHESFNMRGLGLIAAHTLKLNEVFVDLKISAASQSSQFTYDPMTARRLAETRSIWDFMQASEDASADGVALVIIGPPGSGKTTLLQHLAVSIAGERQPEHSIRAQIPILLCLREYALAIENKPSLSLGQIAEQHFSNRYPGFTPPADWFERQLCAGKCVVLLDGLDEVAQQEQRVILSQWIDRQVLHYAKCRFVVTARPQSYRSAPLVRANVVEVQPFNSEQIRRFVENWYLANELVSAGHRLDEGARQRAADGARDLLARLQDPNASAIRALTVNPLMLTMLAMVHRYRGALPANRVELYREFYDVLLGSWREAKGLNDSLTAEQKRSVLMPLAARMMESELREISLPAAMEVIRQPLKRIGVSGDAAEDFLSLMQCSSGLLLERESGRWAFSHLSFQEYLTAAWWAAGKTTPHTWRIMVENAWWHDTLRMYAAQSDATPVLEAALDIDTAASLGLAVEILEEGCDVNAETARAVGERISLALESDDMELRHVAAEVLLRRRLRSLLHIDERSEIDAAYLTCAEYQLFLDEMQLQGRFHHPDHWTDFTFPKGQGREPVLGVRAEDAAAFCKWLTERHGGDAQYRLPAPEEAQAYLFAGKSDAEPLAAWCEIDGEFRLTDFSATEERKIKQALAKLSGAPLPSDLSLSSSIDLDFDSLRAHALDHALALALDLDIDHARNLSFDNALAFAGARLHKLDTARAIAQAIDSGFEGVVALTHIFNRARALARDLVRHFESLHGLPYSSQLGDVEQVVKLLTSLEVESDPLHALDSVLDAQRLLDRASTPAKILTLIADHLRIAGAHDPLTLRLAWQEYATHLLEQASAGAPRLPQRLHMALGWQEVARNDDVCPSDFFRTSPYWWLKIILARADGRLPAWEGIRVVRERR